MAPTHQALRKPASSLFTVGQLGTRLPDCKSNTELDWKALRMIEIGSLVSGGFVKLFLPSELKKRTIIKKSIYSYLDEIKKKGFLS